MNYFAKQRAYNEIFTNPSQPSLHQQIFNNKMLQKQISTFKQDRSSYKQNNYSDSISQDLASTQINSLQYSTQTQYKNNISMNEKSQKPNPYNSPQKVQLKEKQYEKVQENNELEQSKQQENCQNKANKILSSENQINESKQRHNSFSHVNNSKFIQNNQIDVKYFKEIVDSQKNQDEKNKDYKITDEYSSTSSQNGQQFLSDRNIQLPSIITPKKSAFIASKFDNNINSQEKINEFKMVTQETNSLSKSQKIQRDDNKSINISKNQIEIQEDLKDWLIGKTNQSYLFQSINQVKYSPQKDILSINQQFTSPNKKLQNMPEQKKRFFNIDNEIAKQNQKEINNTSINSIDGFDSQPQSLESIQSSQSINQQPISTQNQYINQPSIFKPSSIQPQQSIEIQLNNNIDKLQNQQSSSQPQTILKSLLQTSQNSSQINLQHSDLLLLKKKGLQNSRRNKLQSWMNGLNTEIENLQMNDSQENSQNFEQINLKNPDNQNSEMTRSQVQSYSQQQVLEDQQMMTKSCFFLPKINQRNDFDTKKSQLKKQIMIDSLELKSQTQQVSSPQDKLQKKPSFVQSSDFCDISQKESVLSEQNQISQPAKNKINLGSKIRSRNNSEPLLSRKEINKIEETNNLIPINDFNPINNFNPINDLSVLISQKLGKLRNTINEVASNQQDDNNPQNIYQLKSRIQTEPINTQKPPSIKNIKSILRNKSETKLPSKRPSIITIESTTDTDRDDYSILRKSNAFTKFGNLQSTIGGMSFQRDMSKSINFENTVSPKNQKFLKKVNFNERIDIFDIKEIKEIEQTLKPKKKIRVLIQNDSINFKQ